MGEYLEHDGDRQWHWRSEEMYAYLCSDGNWSAYTQDLRYMRKDPLTLYTNMKATWEQSGELSRR